MVHQQPSYIGVLRGVFGEFKGTGTQNCGLESSSLKYNLTRNVFKKDKRRRIKKEENITQARLSTCT